MWKKAKNVVIKVLRRGVVGKKMLFYKVFLFYGADEVDAFVKKGESERPSFYAMETN